MPLPPAEKIDWTGFELPLLRSGRVRRDGRDQIRAIPSHRVLTADEIGALDEGYPAEKIRGIFWDGKRQETHYTVDYEEHAAHLVKIGRGEEPAEPEPKAQGKKKGKR